MRDIVSWPSTIQSLKGLASAGPVKSLRYVAEKFGKWRKGSAQPINKTS